MAKKILITGGMGYVGSNLRRFLESKGYETYVVDNKKSIIDIANNNQEYNADITDFAQIQKIIVTTKPDIIIHTAALSSLAECEKNKKLAFRINVMGTRNIIASIKEMRNRPKLIFFSSDYVFKGERGNYREEDPIDPQTFYGKTKSISENDITNNLNDFIICRSANIYGNGGNFFNFLINELSNGSKIDVFDNTYFTPTYIGYLMDSLLELIERKFIGIIHVCGNERVTRYEFALKLAEALGIDKSSVNPIKQQQDGLISNDSSLNSDFAQSYLVNFPLTICRSLYYSLGYIHKPFFNFKDDRGKIVGINNEQKWEEINYIESARGSVRGNHFHKETLEGFYIIKGKIKVSLNDLVKNAKREFFVNEGDIFLIPPNNIHTFHILEDSKWINMLSKKMDKYHEDMYHNQ